MTSIRLSPAHVLAGQGSRIAGPVEDALLVSNPQMRRALEGDNGAVSEHTLRLDQQAQEQAC